MRSSLTSSPFYTSVKSRYTQTMSVVSEEEPQTSRALVDQIDHLLKHPQQHTEEERQLATKLVSRAFGVLLTAAEAAAFFGVTKPTILAWIRAGALPVVPRTEKSAAAGTAQRKRMFLELGTVVAASMLLQRVHLRGSAAERAAQLRGLVEDLFWTSHPEERNELMAAIKDADEGRTSTFEGGPELRAMRAQRKRPPQGTKVAASE